MYLAVSVEGKRLYELARKGVVIDRPARTVQVDDITLEEWDEEKQTAVLSVTCGKERISVPCCRISAGRWAAAL